VDENVGLLAVVGAGMRGVSGLAGRIFTAVSSEGISVIAIAQGSNELTINLVVERSSVGRAVKAIHAECGLGRQPSYGLDGGS
jgi:aspartate kinase